MDAPVADDVFLFADYRFDRGAGVLFRRVEDGALVPASLRPRAVAVLDILLARHGNVVSKDEIMHAVWPETVVEENNLTVQISALRRVLDEARSEGSCIQTVPRRGYRFTAPVTRAAAGMQPGFGVSVENRHDTASERALPARAARRGRVFIGIAAGLIFVIAGASWWLGPAGFSSRAVRTAHDAAATTPAAAAIVPPPVAPRLSIVVLPFANLSRDPDQQYFVDGVTDDLTTDLSKIPDLLVISHNTAFTYRDRVGAKRIGRELGVRYVLEGSIERSADKIRVNAQLIDAATDAHLWADRFDRDIGDLFAVQNEITGRIAVALNFAVIKAEAAHPTSNLDTLDYIFRGRAVLYSKSPSRENYAQAIALFERALALDPRSVQAQLFLAYALTGRVNDGISGTAPADIARAEGLVRQAVAASPESPFAHYMRGQVLRAQRRYADAIPEYETVIALDRNVPGAYANIANCKLYIGPLDEVIPLVERAIRLSPRDPWLGYWELMIGLVHLLQSRTDEAIVWLENARSASPAHPIARLVLAAAYGLKGETERAAAELAEARSLSDNLPSSIARLRARRYFVMAPTIRALSEATVDLGLRRAGMPEE